MEGGSAGLASSQHRVMAAATQLMPSPSGLKSMSAFSPFTDSPSSPAHFANVFSNRCACLPCPALPSCRAPADLASAHQDLRALQTTSNHPPARILPPSTPRPSTAMAPARRTTPMCVPLPSCVPTPLTPPQIEDDAQVNHLGDDDAMSDIRSPGTDEIASPASHNSQPKPHRLNTTVPVRTRADSDDAPPSVIHAPASFKDFVRGVLTTTTALPPLDMDADFA